MLTKASLSTGHRRLLKICQELNYGRIEGLVVHAGGEPSFDPPPRIIRDIKLGAADNGPRPELHAEDFVLKREHIELFENLRRLGKGTIHSLEVKAGLPFRLTTVEEHM